MLSEIMIEVQNILQRKFNKDIKVKLCILYFKQKGLFYQLFMITINNEL